MYTLQRKGGCGEHARCEGHPVISDEQLLVRFPGYGIDRDTAPHFRGRLDRRLLLSRCDDCGHWRHPPRPICPVCWSIRITPTAVRGCGTIHLAIFLHRGPPTDGVDYATPYPVVTVELDEQPGLRFTSTVIGAANEAIVIGERVCLDWIERGGTPLPVFRLTGESDPS
jgi:uncharacterized OB-fold protein